MDEFEDIKTDDDCTEEENSEKISLEKIVSKEKEDTEGKEDSAKDVDDSTEKANSEKRSLEKEVVEEEPS